MQQVYAIVTLNTPNVLQGFYSRRINDQHRFVYAVLSNDRNFVDEQGTIYQGIVHVLKMWTHYE